ncbi:MAG: agmatinase family protein [Bdellovibrionales bacterium]
MKQKSKIKQKMTAKKPTFTSRKQKLISNKLSATSNKQTDIDNLSVLAGIFGLASTREESKIILTPVPWEVTTSYGGGTSLGPQAILNASPQIDLFDHEFGEPYTVGYFLDDEDPFFMNTNNKLKILSQKVISTWDEFSAASENEQSLRARAQNTTQSKDLLRTSEDLSLATSSTKTPPSAHHSKFAELPQSAANKSKSSAKSKLQKIADQVNTGCNEMVEKVYARTKAILSENKIPGLIGGDHSTPLGAIKAVCEKYNGNVGILHIDAHADLRLSYQGFHHSHASIMRNVCLLKTRPKKLVQVGIRDFCKEEYDFIKCNPSLISTHFDLQLKTDLHKGDSWHSICDKIINELPEQVYISFDIDGLSPEFCPNTGTPVPGGLSFDQVLYLIASIHRLHKKIVGFDLNEVAPKAITQTKPTSKKSKLIDESDEWDGNVGSRLLFKMCGWAAVTNKLYSR